ncbi:MAG: hypothetical protein LC749_05280 [Actinobacteria bacterium]|nr:hypothetical protein [Actinomycetota bacterium]
MRTRELYGLLGMRRAGLWQVYSPGTLTRYAVAAVRGQHLPRPVEDVRQMGGDALICDGTVVRRWLPRTPDDRGLPARLLQAAKLAALQGPPTPRNPAGNDDQPR